jgi:hypothetical protein
MRETVPTLSSLAISEATISNGENMLLFTFDDVAFL